MADVAPRAVILHHPAAEIDDSAEKLSISLPKSMIRRVEKYFHDHSLPSRSAAILALLERGLSEDRWRQKQ